MNPKNLFIVGWIITAIAASFLILEYYTLSPIFFLIGLAGAAFIGLWRANRMKTRDLVFLVGFSIIIALLDEFAHTSSGILIYFDLNTPSLLTVMGWPLFILVILTVSEYLSRTTVLRQLDKMEGKWHGTSLVVFMRAFPAILAIIMIVGVAYAQGYLSLFSPLLAATYVALGLISLYYTQLRSGGWNLSILISSVAIGGAMELLGGLEGLWWYFYLEPMAWFMMFTWALRTWAILTCCHLVGVSFKEVL